jgi:hypothetical protein
MSRYNDDIDTPQIQELDPTFRSEVAQALPPPHRGHTKVLTWVQEALRQRAEMGKEKYGQYLETYDGRDTDLDALQEALDLVMYLAKKYMEKHGL